MANERLRSAILSSGIQMETLADRIGVDPKTIDRWISGRVPYKKHQYATASVLQKDVAYLWAENRTREEVTVAGEAEVTRVYPHRSAVPPNLWREIFASTETHFDVLVYSGFWLSEDPAFLSLAREKAQTGVQVRFLLGEPDCAAVAQRGADEGIGSAMSTKIRNVLVNYRALMKHAGIEFRLHSTVLYNSIYRADSEMLVNTHVHGVGAYMAPVLHLSKVDGSMFSGYVESFERVWEQARPIGSMEEA